MEVVTVFFGFGQIVVVGHDLTALERCHARLDHAPCFKIKHAFDIAQRHVEHHAQAGWQTLQKPDMRNRAGQFDMTHAFTTHFGHGDFHTALLANNAAMLEALVFAAEALVIFDRAKDFGAEQAIALGLESTVVDGFRLTHFTIRPRTHFFRRGNANLDGIELLVLRDLFE